MRITTLAAACVLFRLTAPAAEIDAGRYLEDVKTLADPAMKGRLTGTPELEKAAKFLAARYEKLGIPPAGGKSYFQWYDVTTNARMGKGNALKWTATGQTHTLEPEKDFVPFNFSMNGNVAGKVVFAGYGITAPEYHYDDYAGIDAKDKVVMILRHEPQEFDDKSVFNGKVYTRHAQMEAKAVNAKFHGARAVIFVSDAANHSDADQVEKFSRNVGPGFRGVPFVQVRAETADQWLALAGRNLKDIMAAIDKDLKPESFDLPASLLVELGVDVQREVKRVPNVCAYLRGATDEYIIIGAHYDHLGLGEQFSMAPSMAGTVHPGADDNASGTAGVLELARWFKAQPQGKRGILFLNFSGEELGLLGSSAYVSNPVLPLDKAVAMLNMDMIGRIRDGKVFLSGSGTGSTFKSILEEEKAKTKLNLDLSEQGGYGSSDHTSFTTKQIPVLFFFSGLHADYHKPSDTADKIDAQDAAMLLEVIAGISTRLIEAGERPQFVRTADPRPQAVAGSSSSSGYGPYFGSIPDMSEVPGGFRISDVRENSPAAKAGLKSGDIIFEFDGKPIGNLMDFTYALRAKKPGDAVTVKYRRSGQEIETKATLEQRR